MSTRPQRRCRTRGGHCVLTLLCLTSILTSCSARAPSEPLRDRRQDQLHHAAHAEFRRGHFVQAMRLYEQALQRAYLRDDAHAVANALYNLAASHARLRHFDQARELLRQARTILENLPETQTADVLLLEAKVAHRQGDLQAALDLIAQGLHAQPPAPEAVMAAFHVLRGVLAAEQHNLALARQALATADQYRRSGQETAGRAQLIGSIARLANEPLRAAAAFEREADLHRSASHYEAMAQALARAATAYTAASAWSLAAHRFLRAGRSAQLQGMYHEAIAWLQQAIDTARKGGVSDITDQANERLRAIRQTTSHTS